MSTINKKPFIKSLIESLTEEQLSTLSALIDGGGNQTAILRTLQRTETSTRKHITAADKGVRLCNLQIEYSLFNGYLIYNDTYCVLISFTDSQKLTMFDINGLANIDEELSVLELRSELKDIEGGGGANAALLAPLFDATVNYEANSLVVYGNSLYTNPNPVSAGEWDPTEWTTTTIADSVLGLINTAL